MSYAVEFKPYSWVVGAGIYLDDVHEIFWAQARQMGMLVGLALLLVAGLFLLVGRSIVNPINAMTAAMRKIAGGETSTSIPALERGDEVGAMAQSVQVFKDSMIDAIRLRGEQDVLKAQADAEEELLLNPEWPMSSSVASGRPSTRWLAPQPKMQATSKTGMSATASEARPARHDHRGRRGRAGIGQCADGRCRDRGIASSVSEIGRRR